MDHKPTSSNPVLVIVGMPGSGKSTVARYLQGQGWRVIHFGEITMRELKARGLPPNEPNERMVRERLREEHGMDAYARLLLPTIEDAVSISPTAIDGLYSWAEYKLLRQHLGSRMHVVATFTTRSKRYERLCHRPDRPLTPEESELRDVAEIENLEKGGPIAMADHVILNDASEEELLRAVDRLLCTRILAEPKSLSGHQGERDE